MKDLLKFIAIVVVIATVGALIWYLGSQLVDQPGQTATIQPAVTFQAGEYGTKDFTGGICAEAIYTADSVTVTIVPCETD